MNNDLSEYLQRALQDKRLSQRAFAKYAGVASSTISRIIQGHPVDTETLQKIADYLKVPVENLYRLAGLLVDDVQYSETLKLVEHLFAKLPESDQQEVIDIIKLKIERHGKH